MKIKKQSSYSIGDRVRIVPLDELKRCLKRRSDSEIDEWAGKIVTIRKECPICGGYWTEGDNPDWCWTHDMIEGKVIEMKEVARKANIGEWIKIVKAETTHDLYENGDIIQVEDFYLASDTGLVAIGEWVIRPREYVVLENYEPCEYIKTDKCDTCRHDYEPKKVSPYKQGECHPEFAEGSTFEVVDGGGVAPLKSVVTLSKNDGTGSPYFNENSMAIRLSRLYPINIIYRKHEYTPAQIEEARRYVADKMYELADDNKCIHFDVEGRQITVTKINQWGEKAVATCPDNVVYSCAIGRMVATKKLFHEDMPSWLK
jgi:hypothetical protein